MKQNFLRISAFAMIAAAAVHAQSSGTLTANVPFDFIVGNQTLHAGQYTVDQGNIGGEVIVKRMGHKDAAIAMTNAIQSVALQSEARLVFRRYGNTYFLTEVWVGGASGREFRKTRQERELAARRVVPVNTTLVTSR
jgi:hypothetical protein